LFLTFSVFKASLVVGGSMVSGIFNSSPLWPGDACGKDTNHCVHYSQRHLSACANVKDDKQLSATERAIWTQRGTVLGWRTPLSHTVPWRK